MATRVALVSCVKTKQKCDAPARDLYTSQLFRGMRRYAEQNADVWYILSAKYGVLRPDEVVSPYEQTLNAIPRTERIKWAERVREQLLGLLPAKAVVVILAGERYREGIVAFLEERGFQVEIPMAGLSFGEQLRWLRSTPRPA